MSLTPPPETPMTNGPIPEPPAKSRAARKTPVNPSKRAPMGPFYEAMELLGLPERELAERLGFSRGAMSHWRRGDGIPPYVAFACTTLIENFKLKERLESKLPTSRTLILVAAPSSQKEVVETLLKALGASVTHINPVA